MNTSRLICGTILVVTSGLVGCGPVAPPAPQSATPPLLARNSPSASALPKGNDDGLQPSPPEAPLKINTAEALAQRAQSYAQFVKPQVVKHSAPKVSESDWPDPGALHLTPQAEAGATVIDGETDAGVSGPGTPPAVATTSQPPLHVTLIPGDGASAPAAAIVPHPPSPAAPDSLASDLSRRATDYPQDLSAQMDNQLLRFLKDEPVPDMQSLASLPSEDRELLDALMDSLTNFRNQLRADNNMLFTKKIRPLTELGDRLRGQAELSVPTVALCTKVNAFGVYEPIQPARFIAGKEQRVVLYCEVENFLSQVNDRNFYETRLAQDAVLYTESSGQRVWGDKQSVYTDLARRRRHDFFMGKIIVLPSNLTIGRYLLKVTVEDQQARHIAENTVPIEIAAQ